MLSELHHITHEVLCRKSNKWADVTLEHSWVDLNKIHTDIINELLNCLDKLSLGSIQYIQLSKILANICGLKDQLEQTTWSPPIDKDEETLLVFTSDLTFYLMLIHILNQSSEIYKGYYNPEEQLADIYLYPKLNYGNRQLKAILKYIIQSYTYG